MTDGLLGWRVSERKGLGGGYRRQAKGNKRTDRDSNCFPRSRGNHLVGKVSKGSVITNWSLRTVVE